MTIEVLLFGPLRPYAKGELRIELPEGARAKDAREAIAAALERTGGATARALVARSALGTEDEVLLEDAPLPSGTRSLAVLPPVCGG